MLRVLVADDHELIRPALGALLDREPDIEVVAEVSTGADALAAAVRVEPHVAVLDMNLPDLGGVQTALQFRARNPHTSVLLLTPICHVAEMKRAVAAGALGLLRKDVSPDRLIAAVREVGQGAETFDPRLVSGLLRERHEAPTCSELRVLEQVAAGSSIREVANHLSLAQGTVRNYISSVISKTQARNRLDAIRIAREYGWLV
jgi:two-component system response regulator DesR